MLRSFTTYLFCFFLIMLLGIGPQSVASNNAAYQARQQAYNDSALAHFNVNAMIIQAYMGLPVDSAALASTLLSVPIRPTIDFAIEQLVRVLYFSHGTYDSMIVPVLRTVPYWINYGDTIRGYYTENHMIQWMSSAWLLHERYGLHVDSQLHSRLIYFLKLKNQFGYYEFYSSTYSPFSLAALLNLADFSQDTVIKNLATRASQVLMRDFMTLTNDKGVFFPAAGRNYAADYELPYGGDHNNIIWLLTGMGQMPIGASHGGTFLSTSTVSVDSAAQSWVPVLDTVIIKGHSIDSGYAMNSVALDSTDRVIFQLSAGEYFNAQCAVSTYQLLTDSNLWHNSGFIQFLRLSTVPVSIIPALSKALNTASYSSVLCTDTIAIFKHQSITLSSILDYWPGYWGYEQYPCVANVETTAVYTRSGMVDSIWTNRNAHTQNDDMPYVKQVKNVALEMYRPLPKSTILTASDPTVSLHWRNGDFSEVRNDSLWLLGRVDNNYIGVRRPCAGMIGGLWACDITPGSSWVIIVGDSLMYGSFNNFQAVIDSSQFTERWYYDSVAHLSDYYAQIIVDGDTVNHLWGIDSTTNTGIKNIPPDPAQDIVIYPNPANTSLNISLAKTPVNGTIEVYSIIGKVVYQSSISSKDISIPTTQWSDGIYEIRVSEDTSLMLKRFVISH